jgi:hypothetical protein
MVAAALDGAPGRTPELFPRSQGAKGSITSYLGSSTVDRLSPAAFGGSTEPPVGAFPITVILNWLSLMRD